jgi:putative ABC transport system permease protein
MLANYIKIAWKVLLRHPFYTFITLFGISLTLTVLMVLTSLLDHLIGEHYPESNRDRSLYLFNMTFTGTDPRSGISSSSGAASYIFMKRYVKTLKTPENVGVCSIEFGSVDIYNQGKRLKFTSKYTDEGFWEVTNFEFLQGKPFNKSNIDDRVIVVTDGFQAHFFGNNSQNIIGKTVNINTIGYRIIGVVRGSPLTRPFTFSDIYFPYTDPKSGASSEDMRGGYVAIIRAKDNSDIPLIKREFNHTISLIKRPIISGGTSYSIIDIEADTYLNAMLNPLFGSSDMKKPVFYSVIGLIMLMLMGLPIINLVNVNISRIIERSSEIGIRKSFGAPRRTLLWQFITENIFITFLGCTIALILTGIVLYLLNGSGLIANADLTINFNVFTVTVLICFAFGFLSGVLPALRMSKMKIVDALKG